MEISDITEFFDLLPLQMNPDIHDSKTSNIGSEISQAMKTASEPVCPLPEAPQPPNEAHLKIQISAPSYLLSLKENDAPPFKRPGKETRPMLLIGTIMNEMEAIEMVAAADADKENGLKKWLSEFLVEKKIILNYKLSEKKFLISLITELIDYAAQRDFSAFKLATLLTVYLATHLYFKWYYWNSPLAVWGYFKELMIRHTIEDSPFGQEVFAPEECYDLVTHFHTVYLSNLPLVHILSHGAHRLKLQWPFKAK